MQSNKTSWRRRISSGAGNTMGTSSLPSFAFESPVECVAWNARALAHHNLEMKHKEAVEVLALCRQYSVVALLDAHGNHLALPNILVRCFRTHYLYSNQMRNDQGEALPATGGICLHVGRDFWGKFRSASTPMILPPRLLPYFANLRFAGQFSFKSFPKGPPLWGRPFSLWLLFTIFAFFYKPQFTSLMQLKR